MICNTNKFTGFYMTRVSFVTSTNVGFSPKKNSLTFSFYPFAKLVRSFKAMPSASPKLLNSN